MGAYSFLNVQASLIGPGGSLNVGPGSGAAEEGITVSMAEEKGDTKVGADGQLMQSLRASNLGHITLRLLKTSPVNAQLSAMYNTQKTLSSLWGNNVLRVSDVVRGDVVLGTQMAFTKHPDIVYAKDGNTNEWVFTGNVEEQLGTGSPVAS
jgi:hypothetical protein